MRVSNLQDFKVNVRIKISALWTAVLFCYIYGDYFELYVPDKVNGLIRGENLLHSPVKLLVVTIIMSIPAVMIFLSLILKANSSKWTNFVIGIFFTVLTLLVGISSMDEWRMFYVYLSFLESFITIVIVWQAWTWEKINAG